MSPDPAGGPRSPESRKLGVALDKSEGAVKGHGLRGGWPTSARSWQMWGCLGGWPSLSLP
jgi:hypothetical protein